jgi:hypothetical protein
MINKELIQLKATYSKKGLHITDQWGREFAQQEVQRYSQSGAMEVTLEAPFWPHDKMYAIVSIRVPVDVDENARTPFDEEAPTR